MDIKTLKKSNEIKFKMDLCHSLMRAELFNLGIIKNINLLRYDLLKCLDSNKCRELNNFIYSLLSRQLIEYGEEFEKI